MILEAKDIHAFYGTSHILFGISMEIGEGEAVCRWQIFILVLIRCQLLHSQRHVQERGSLLTVVERDPNQADCQRSIPSSPSHRR